MNNPDLYAQSNQFQKEIVTAVVKDHLAKFRWRPDGKDTLIDLGSGTGDMLMEVVCSLMEKKFHRIVCSDLNAIMVDFARAKYGHVSNSEFKIFDVCTTLSLPDDLKGQFDHVTSFYCLQLVENQRKALDNIYSLLRPEGGDCLLTIFAKGPYYDAYLCLSKTSKWSEYMTEIDQYTCCWHYAENPEEDIRKLLEECGFSDIAVKLVKKCCDFPNVETFKSTMLAVSHYVHHMPKELQQEFMDDFVEAVVAADVRCKYIGGPGSAFRFYYEQLVIFARRPGNGVQY